MEKAYKDKKNETLVLGGILLFGLLELAFIKWLLPAYYTWLLLFIPVYFLGSGMSLLWVLAQIKRKKLPPGREMMQLMLFNVIQMALSFMLIFCYFFFVKVQKNTVLIAFCVYYLFFMGMKSYILYNLGKQSKTGEKKLLIILLLLACSANTSIYASESSGENGAIKPKEIIFEHIQDTYWWHITTIHDRHISVHLPVILYSSNSGFHLFSSSHLDHGHKYKGFYISDSEKYAGKIVELDAGGRESRPFDISITKIAASIILNSILMVSLFLWIARRYKKRPKYAVPGGFAGMMEAVIMYVEEDIIRVSIGKDYARYSPYLLTAFFFILISNLMGMIPIFPGGANLTGNIAVTCVLALCTLTAVNLFGNKAYWKDIFWPDIPIFLKAPIPLMPVIEFFGIFSKIFALAIRLFANITAGHALVISLTCLVFISARMGTVAFTGMTAFSILLTLFINVLELLVAFLQAYVFTMLSAVFIGLSRAEHSHICEHEHEVKS